VKAIVEREDRLNNVFLREFHNLMAHKAHADYQYSKDVEYVGKKIEALSNQINNEMLQDQLVAISTNFLLLSKNTRVMSSSLKEDIQTGFMQRMEKSLLV
jgi:hypothetical protein